MKCLVWKFCRGYRVDADTCNERGGEYHFDNISCSFYDKTLKREGIVGSSLGVLEGLFDFGKCEVSE